MAIAFRNAGTVASGLAAINPGLPTLVADDIHVLVIETENEPVPAMTGWNNVGAGTINVATGSVTALTIRWRPAQAGDTAPTVPDSGNHQIARIAAFSGVDTTNPWDVTLFGTETVADTSVSFPNPTTTTANTMIVHCFGTGQDTATAQSSSTATNAGLTNLTIRMNDWTTSGTGGGFAMFTGEKASIGAVGVTTSTMTGTANFKTLFTGALKEATVTPASSIRAFIMAPRRR